MIIIPDNGDITLGTGIKDSDGKIHLTTMPMRDGKVEPLISETAPGWKTGASWPTIYGGSLNLRLNGDGTNSFYAAKKDGKKSSGVVNFPEKYKYDIYPFLIDGTFTFILLRDVGTLEPFSVFKDLIDNFITFDKQVGSFKIGIFPIVLEIQYIVYPIERNLALQIIGRSAIANGITPMLIEYPDIQQEGTSKYFNVISYDSGNNIDFAHWNQARVLSMTSEAWTLYPDEFTVTVKASEFIFLYIHVKQGEFIESGYFYEDPNDEVHDQAGIFGKIDLTENRKCTAYLYWLANQLEGFDYLNYGGFVFCFDKDKENSENFHDVQLEIGNSYLVNSSLQDACYLIHNFSNNEIFNKFLLTNPFDVSVKNGGPTSNFLKSKYALWDIISIFDNNPKFYVDYPREIFIDYDSDLWGNSFSLSFPVTETSYFDLSYNIDTKELTGFYFYNNELYSQKILNIPGEINDGSCKNPILFLFKQTNYGSSTNSYQLGKFGIICVQEIPLSYMQKNHPDNIQEKLLFYDNWDFHGDKNQLGSYEWREEFSATGLNYWIQLSINYLGFYEPNLNDDNLPQIADPVGSNDTTTNFKPDKDNESNNINVTPNQPDDPSPQPDPKPITPNPNPTPSPTPQPNPDNFNTPQDTTGDNSGNSNETPEYDNKSDKVDPPIIPAIASTGLYSIYLIAPSQIQILAQFLWSKDFLTAIEQYLFKSPLDSIINLSYCFIEPIVGTSENITLHGMNSGANGQRITSQILSADFGYIDIPRNFASFMDYSPKTKIEIFLPFIGSHVLDTNTVMGSRIHLIYFLDFYSGCCTANIEIVKDNNNFVGYSFNGNFLTRLPVTAEKYDNLLATMFSISSAVLTKNPLMALGALTPDSLGTSIQHISDSVGNFGALSVKEPYLTISRPSPALSSGYRKIYGIPSNIYDMVENFSGFTKFDSILLENIPATSVELNELYQLFKNGVYL